MPSSNARTLTALSVAKLKPAAVRLEIPDAGCPGLRLVIQPSGAKSWAMRFRNNGKAAKLTLGPLDLSGKEAADQPRIGYPLTLAAAHALATDIKRQRARDIDVITETKADRKRRRDENMERASNTFGSIVREFIIKYRTKKWNSRPRRWRSDAATLGLRYPIHCDPAKIEPEEIEVLKGSLAATWADKPIAAIDKYQVEAVIEDARKHGSDSRARKLYSVLSVLFGWLPLKYRVAVNPMIGVKRPGPPSSRDRKLEPSEIVLFWKACDSINGVFGSLYKTLLLTGCRLREVSGMSREELNGVWEVPGDRSKNHLSFLVPLPQQALDIIKSVPLPHGIGHNNPPEPIELSGLIFTTNGKTPVSGFSKAKKALDAEMAKVAGRPIKPWRVHDLRRTFSTTLNESPDDGGLGIAPHIVEAALNHISGGAKSGVAGTYNKAKYLSEKRVALERWADHIEGLVSGRQAKVVPIEAAAAAKHGRG
ncbi:Phage integrase family protein [Bradyrhizobium erythrophlei]|nr:Phage integrase family protein [Bradyrhizobium erythrophlei]